MEKKVNILVVDDEAVILNAIKTFIKKEKGYLVKTAKTGKEAIELVKDNEFDVVILDLKLPDIDGLDVLKEIKSINEDISVIMMTGYGTVESAVRAMQLGAENFLLKPFKSYQEIIIEIDKIIEYKALKEENKFLKEQIGIVYDIQNIIGKSPKMREIFKMIRKVAPIDTNVLIEGESGTGKELIARAIHENSKRAKNRFVAINCAAIPPNLFESELFGYEKGAFTGASEQKDGYIDLAQGGTLFFDEISEMPLELQAKLLRVLQEKRYMRVGGTKELIADIRVISSTNKNLEDEVANENFREDLYYRINVVKITVPPLRERLEDIPLLVDYFLNKYTKKFDKNIEKIHHNVIKRLLSYPWNGNVRELENTIERAVALAESDEITEDDLPDFFKNKSNDLDISEYFNKPYREAKLIFERRYLENLLKKTGGNILKASHISKLPRQNLYEKLKKHEIAVEKFRQ